MKLSHFFIDRPIFAMVVSIFITLVGGLAYFSLPVAQYPEIAPPTIVISATYPGASAQVVSETVATPLQQEMDGVGDVQLRGAGDYAMRIWLDPEKVAARGLTAGDVVAALQEQNVQVASGVLNEPPVPKNRAFEVNVETLGRLVDPRQFSNIIVRTDPDCRVTRVRDIARVELGAQDYNSNAYLDHRQAVPMLIFQRPGSNALATAGRLKVAIEELSKSFPSGLRYDIIYNPTNFIAESVN